MQATQSCPNDNGSAQMGKKELWQPSCQNWRKEIKIVAMELLKLKKREKKIDL